MLLSAGISMSDPLLTTFLQVARINDAAFGFLEHAVQPSTISRPSYELLIQVVARTAKFASWSDASSDAQEPLMMVAFDDKRELSRCDFDLRWHDLTFRVKLPQLGAEASSGQSCFCSCLGIHAPPHLRQPIIHASHALQVCTCADNVMSASYTMVAARAMVCSSKLIQAALVKMCPLSPVLVHCRR